MRFTKWMPWALLVLFAVAGGIRADEAPDDGTAAASARLEAVARGLDVLRVRMEARLEAARVLRELGRPEEALPLLRSVDEIYEEGLARLERVIERGERPATPIPPRAVLRLGGRDREPAVRVTPPPGDWNPVEEALRWLAAHQAPDGRWGAEDFDRWCDGKPYEAPAQERVDRGKALYDVGVTGLALQAFLGAGHTNRGDHPFAKVVAKGLRWLKTQQDAEGCFGPRTSQHYVYNHAAAALAMVEAYGMTQSPIFKASAQQALDFIALSRNPYFAWRYGVKPGENDTSVTGWMLAPLASARAINEAATSRGLPAPLVIDDEAFDGARNWIEKMTDPDYGRVGYIQRGGSVARPQAMIDRFPGDKSEAMTAVGILIRIYTGEDPHKSAIIQKGAKLLESLPPDWNPTAGTIDMYYWTFGARAASRIGGSTWKKWARALRQEVAANQRRDTDHCLYRGSWDPIDPWSADGGRVYATAMMALALETVYR